MLGVVLLFLVTLLFEYLWNITMPKVFSMKLLTFWQAFRLLLMAWLLAIGGFIHFNFGR